MMMVAPASIASSISLYLPSNSPSFTGMIASFRRPLDATKTTSEDL